MCFSLAETDGQVGHTLPMFHDWQGTKPQRFFDEVSCFLSFPSSLPFPFRSQTPILSFVAACAHAGVHAGVLAH